MQKTYSFLPKHTTIPEVTVTVSVQNFPWRHRTKLTFSVTAVPPFGIYFLLILSQRPVMLSSEHGLKVLTSTLFLVFCFNLYVCVPLAAVLHDSKTMYFLYFCVLSRFLLNLLPFLVFMLPFSSKSILTLVQFKAPPTFHLKLYLFYILHVSVLDLYPVPLLVK